MTRLTSNPFPLICEVDITISHDEQSGRSKCVCTLRFGEDDFSHDGTVYAISISRALLQLDLQGFEIVPGTRFGEPTVSNTFETRKSYQEFTLSTRQKSLQGGVGGQASTDIAEVPSGDVHTKLGGNVSTEKRTELELTSEQVVTHHRVKARGGNYWEITDQEPDGKTLKLNRTYMNHEILCELLKSSLANRNVASAAILVKKKDIEIKIQRDGAISLVKSLTTNKEKVLNIMAAKVISKLAGSEFSSSGSTIIGYVEVEVEK